MDAMREPCVRRGHRTRHVGRCGFTRNSPSELVFKRQGLFPAILLSWASFTCSSGIHDGKKHLSSAPALRALFSQFLHVPSAMRRPWLMIPIRSAIFLGDAQGVRGRETRVMPRPAALLEFVFQPMRAWSGEANHRLIDERTPSGHAITPRRSPAAGAWPWLRFSVSSPTYSPRWECLEKFCPSSGPSRPSPY